MRSFFAAAAVLWASVAFGAGQPAGVLYDPAAPGSAGQWQFYGAKAERAGNSWRATFEPESSAYMLWTFNRNWSGRAQLEVSVDAAQDATVGVAVFDDFDSVAIHVEKVKAGPARIVLPMQDILADGLQPLYVKKVVVWADAAAKPATLTLGKVELTGAADFGAFKKNWMTLCDAESAHSESMWEQWRSGRAVAVKDHATEGVRAIKLQLTGEKFNSAYGFVQTDWRGYEKLVFDVFNPEPNEVTLRVSFRPSWLGADKPEAMHDAVLKPGANHVVCDLKTMVAAAEAEAGGKKFDLTTVQNFPFRLVGNPESKVVFLYLDDIRLEGASAKRPEPAPAFLTKSHEAEWYARFGMKDPAFVAAELSREELDGAKPVTLTDLAAAKPGELWAGAAEVNILPREAREGKGRKAVSNLYTRAVVLSDGKTTAAIVTLDMLAAWFPVADVARARAAKLAGIPESNVFIWATHNHSGPQAWGPMPAEGAARNFKSDLVDWIATAVVRARQNMQPVAVRAARGSFNLNFNRRYVTPDGMGAGFLWNKYLEPEWDRGAVDKEMGLVVLEAAAKPVATLVMYSGHANMNTVIDQTYNADYPGIACRTLEDETGAPVLFINGSFGNVDVKGNALSQERTVKAALDVARAAASLRAKLAPVAATPVRAGTLSRKAQPLGDKPAQDIAVSALAFGDVAFAQPSGELFTELGMGIKKGSPYPYTYTTFWRGGYLPTRKAVETEGGYGTDGRGPDWGELSRDLCVELLKQMRER